MTQNKSCFAVWQLVFAALLLSSNFVLSKEKVPFNQMVFPPEIQSCPLLFVDSAIYLGGKSWLSDNEAPEYIPFINTFIEHQKTERNITHQLISINDLVDFPVEEYRFFIQPVFLEIIAAGFGKPVSSFWVSYMFIDRKTNKKYDPYAGVNDFYKGPTYGMNNLDPPRQKNYFKTLKRILKNLESKGPEKTYKKEWKIQNRENWGYYISIGLVTIAVPVIGVIIG